LLEEIEVAANTYRWLEFDEQQEGEWIRATASRACRATAWFEYRGLDTRDGEAAGQRQSATAPFDGMATVEMDQRIGGYVRAGTRDDGLHVWATAVDGNACRETGYYVLRPDLSLVRVEASEKQDQRASSVAVPQGVLTLDGNSILYRDDDGTRYRLPIGNPLYRERPALLDLQRVSREVTTERDLFQCAGTFYELPARNAGGFAKIRPIATHPLFVQDYCSWRGLLVMTGTAIAGGEENTHLLRSADGQCTVWLGAVDDLWNLGQPAGRGGPWTDSAVQAGVPSDPYLCAGYNRKKLTLVHDAGEAVSFRLEADISGTGKWVEIQQLEVPAAGVGNYRLPQAFQAYWMRLIPGRNCTVTADFVYH